MLCYVLWSNAKFDPTQLKFDLHNFTKLGVIDYVGDPYLYANVVELGYVGNN